MRQPAVDQSSLVLLARAVVERAPCSSPAVAGLTGSGASLPGAERPTAPLYEQRPG